MTQTTAAESRRADYQRNGYIIVRGLFTLAEMNRVSDEAEILLRRTDLIDTKNLRCRWQTNVQSGECSFETFDPVLDIAPACRALAHDTRLTGLLAELYGEPACLFKDKLIFKPPGVNGYGLHQDWIAWPGFPRSFLTVLIPLDAATKENGCTEVFPGYHHRGCLSVQDGHYHELPAEAVNEAEMVALELQPGDVAVFGGFTPHRSGPNRSGRWRRQLYLSYNAQSDGGEQRTKHYGEFHAWLRKRYADHGKTDVYFE
jgi:ectoine hydroxylase-related dioxygenase (phytanoyl-CoA dioxygenase family)